MPSHPKPEFEVVDTSTHAVVALTEEQTVKLDKVLRPRNTPLTCRFADVYFKAWHKAATRESMSMIDWVERNLNDAVGRMPKIYPARVRTQSASYLLVEVDIDRWKAEAERVGESLTGWVERVLNEAASVPTDVVLTGKKGKK